MNNLKIESKNNIFLNLNKIGIVYNFEHKQAFETVEKIKSILSPLNIEFSLFEITPQNKNDGFDKNVDTVIVVGGDGTLLAAARFYSKLNIPILGINIGRLGFLSQVKSDELEEGLKKLLSGKFKIEERVMLNSYTENGINFSALNDIVIKSGSLSRTAKLFLYINDKHVCDYLADGLIVSTPTGSTAYNLSAGGPVLLPWLDALVVTPICPHSLTTRPVIISAEEKIKVEIKTDFENVYLTADGQQSTELKSICEVYIQKNEQSVKLILLEKENNGFFSILREKLHWGISPGY